MSKLGNVNHNLINHAIRCNFNFQGTVSHGLLKLKKVILLVGTINMNIKGLVDHKRGGGGSIVLKLRGDTVLKIFKKGEETV